MANTTPTKVGFFKAVYLCILLLVCPKKFVRLEEEDNRKRENQPKEKNPVPRALIVRGAFFKSLFLVLFSVAVGALVALGLQKILESPSSDMITILQIVAALLLLWGTLFIRGWEILSWGGVTFTERVNQWIYRSLYCLGTAIIVLSLVWPG